MKAQLLIVDDEESIRFTFESFLADAGYRAATASDAAEALQRMDETDFDLILADILLKDGSGMDILRKVRQEGLSCPVIMITGDPNIETAADAVRLGAFDYLTKPISQEKLLHTVGMALRHKALMDEKEKYRSNLEAIFRSVKDSIITVDSASRVVEINDAAMRMCGITREVIGRPFSEMPKGCSGKCVQALDETTRNRQPLEIYRIECQPPGRPRYVVNLTTYPLINEQNVFSGVVMVFKDETRLADLEGQLQVRRQFHRLVGGSEPMQRLYCLLDALAGVQTTVLITGESGTGKELVAEALHYRGARGHKPLVKVNCSALPESLLESELFGHVKGAFTGALQDKTGRFERADGGTIFLDEIGDISPKLQMQLLRVLQEREIERVGDPRPIKVDVRIITATNRDLQEKVRLGELREDLYYRLKVVKVHLPPLRERREDIPLLLDHFIEKFNGKFRKEIKGVSDDVQRVLLEHPWPGNVRELEHAIEHAFVLCRQPIITLAHLPPDLVSPSAAPPLAHMASGDNERQRIAQALEKTDGNKAKAARLLGMDRKTLYRKLERYGF